VISLEPGIVTRAQKGDPTAFTQVVEAYQRPVFNLCYRMLGDPEDAEDAAQETFLRAYDHMRRYDQQRSFSTWLLSIAAHYCIDQLRKRRMTFLSMDTHPNLDIPDQNLLRSLGAQDRAAVVMYYWYDFSYDEIADSLSLSTSAVKSRLHRARLLLAQTWTEQEAKKFSAERKPHESPAV
jgi:RNA polymerase sigma-70 factor (ECF subfamily)